MRQLLPHPADDIDVGAAYAVARPAVDRRPWTVGLMASTADGAATVEGLSGAIGGPGDATVFRAVRAAADVVVVGAGTVTAEGYGPVRVDDAAAAGRQERGQAAHPALVVVSGRLSLAPDHPALDGGRAVVAHGPGLPADRVAAFAGAADLLETPLGPDGHGLDPGALLAALGGRGHRVAVVEGGPTLNGTLVAADLLDELCLTLDPRVVGGAGPRIVVGADGTARPWRTAHLLADDDALFWRLVRDRS